MNNNKQPLKGILKKKYDEKVQKTIKLQEQANDSSYNSIFSSDQSSKQDEDLEAILNQVPVTADRKWNQKNQEMKKGKFSDEEIKILIEAITDYAIQNQLSEYELEQLCSASTKTTIPKAWIEIGQCLTQRNIMSIHNFVHRKFNPDNYKGEWTQEEEERLLQLVEQHGRKWAEISKHLNRTERNIRDKYRQLGDQHHSSRVISIWSFNNIIKLLRLVERYVKLGVKFLEENDYNWEGKFIKNTLFNKSLKKQNQIQEADHKALNNLASIIDQRVFCNIKFENIPWTKIQKKIKDKSQDDIRNFWHNQLVPWIKGMRIITQNQIRQMVRDIEEQRVDDEKEIDFDYVLPQVDFMSKEEKKKKWNTIRKQVQGRRIMSINQIIDTIKRLKDEECNNIVSEELNEYQKLIQRFNQKK